MANKKSAAPKAQPVTTDPQDETPQTSLNTNDTSDVRDVGAASADALDQMGFAGQQSLDLGSLLGGLMSQGGAGAASQGQPDLSELLGGLLGGGTPQGGASAQGGGLDLGELLGGLLGGGAGMPGDMMSGAAMGGPLDGIIGPLADDLSGKLGIPRQVIMMGAMFLVSKLMSGGLQQDGAAPSSVSDASANGGMPDLGSILGGLLGGMNGPTAPSAQIEPADGGEVLGRIGQPIGETASSGQPSDGIQINGLTAGDLRGSSMVTEFAEYADVDEDTAERSLSALMQVLGGEQK